MAEQDDTKLARLAARPAKIAASARLQALFNLADRVAMQAMRAGGYDQRTLRMVGAFAPWGEFLRDLKAAIDAAEIGEAVVLPQPPPLPDVVDGDLQPAIRHFAGLAGVPIPEQWSR